MKVLELFAGSRSFCKEAEKLGLKTFSTDFKPFDNIDLVIDILELDNDLLMQKLFEKGIDKVDCIWASPPCTSFSVAAIGRHWHKDHTPKTKEAELGVKIVQKTLDIIKFLKPDYFFIENPRGKLRKLEVVKGIPRTTVWYCQYGDNAAKPTDIWSNFIFEDSPLFNDDNRLQGWKPRKMCFNGNLNCHHDRAPRGTTVRRLKKEGLLDKSYKAGGTAAKKNNYERSKVPSELCKEILNSCL
jgi:hypothetical protein